MFYGRWREQHAGTGIFTVASLRLLFLIMLTVSVGVLLSALPRRDQPPTLSPESRPRQSGQEHCFFLHGRRQDSS
jgi:hypothetical protein